MNENKRPVSIYLRSRQFETAHTELFRGVIETFGDELDLSALFQRKDGEDLLEMRTQAMLTREDGRIDLSYDETELTGMEGATTKISFSEAHPDVITMLRYGSVSTALVFEQGKRHICVYDTSIMPFEICVLARSVCNTLTMDGGKIELDYLVEIHGAKAERTVFILEVTPTDINAQSETGELS